MAVSGVAFVLAVHDGAATYNTLKGQRGTTLNRGMDEADATTKDDASWHIGLATIRNWSFDAEGVVDETDPAYIDLEDHFTNLTTGLFRITTPAATTYIGTGIVSNLVVEGAHDDVLTYTVSVTGITVLTKT